MIKDCAQITIGTPHVITNAIAITDEDFALLAPIWSDYFPGQYILLMESMPKRPDQVWQISRSWYLDDEGFWVPPPPP